jgi:cell division protein FtsB
MEQIIIWFPILVLILLAYIGYKLWHLVNRLDVVCWHMKHENKTEDIIDVLKEIKEDTNRIWLEQNND